jgi:tetratricopeptide (TPR) repeat protein
MTEPKIYVDDERFLGRETEQEQFRRALTDVMHAEDDAPPTIFLIHGEGGMGKSQLTRRFRAIAADEEPFAGAVHALRVDWEIWRHRVIGLQVPRAQIAPETLLDTLYRAAIEADDGWERHFKAYQDALKDRAQAERQVAEALDKEMQEGQYAGLRDLGAAGLAKLVRRGSQGFVGDAGEEKLRAGLADVIQGGAEGLYDLRTRAQQFLHTRAQLKDALYDLYLHPHEQLARALGDSLESLTRPRILGSRPLVLVLDTYEIVAATEPILREVIRTAGPRVLWIIAGRDDLAASRPPVQYIGYSAEFSPQPTTWDIQELSIDHYCAYLQERAPDRETTREDAVALHRATVGVPLAMRQAGDLWADGVELTAITEGIPDYAPRAAIVRLMCERVLMHVQKSHTAREDRRALYLLAMQPRPDPEVQAAVLRPAVAEGEDAAAPPFSLRARLAELARAYSSVRLEAGARLHDAMAAYLHEYLLKTEAGADDLLPAIAERALAALRARRAALEADLPTLADRVESADWQQTTLDLVHWLLWQDERAAWHEFIPRFVEGLGYDPDLARALRDILEPFTLALSKDGKKRYKALALETARSKNLLDALEALLERQRSSTSLSGTLPEALLDELERLTARGWLGAQDAPTTAERRAILHLMRGRWLMQQQRYPETLRALQTAERILPPAAAALHPALGRAFYDLSGHFLWPDASRDAVGSEPGLQAARRAKELTPEHADSWYRMGAALARLNQSEEAIAAYQKAIDLDATDAYPWHGLGNVYRALGRYDEAIEAYQHASDLDATFAYPWNGLGNVYRDLGRYDEAIEAYQHASDLDATDASPWNGLGHVYLALGRYDEAIEAYQHASDLDATFAYPWNGLGNVYLALGRYDEAIAACKRAIQLDIQFSPAYGSLLGIYLQQEQPKQARSLLQRAFECLEPNSLIWNGISQDKQKTARKILNRMLEIVNSGKSPEAFLIMSIIYLVFGNAEEALFLFNQALHITPDYFENLDVLVDLSVAWGELADCWIHLSGIASHIPLSSSFLKSLAYFMYLEAQSRIKSGCHEEAITAYQKAIALDATDAYPWNGLGHVYRDLGRHEEAIAAYQHASDLDATAAYPWNGLGNVYRDQGCYDEALEAYQQAIDLDATDAYPWNGLGP